jgi:branched-chain amino acid transport system substrate-binding protein
MARELKGSEPWRVGVLWSQSGATAVIEETQLKGTMLALEEINSAGGINGREVVPVIYDPASEAINFARYAERLLSEDRVNTIFGCYTSSSRKAVLPIVERRNGLLWYPTLYEGFEYSPNIIYTGAAPNQTCLQLVEYLMETYGSRFYFIGSNYIYPRESNRIMHELLHLRGGRVVGEDYVDLLAPRHAFVPIMRDVKRAAPDVIFSTVVGRATTHLYQAYADAGFDPTVMPIASLTTSEAEIRNMGSDVAAGHVTAACYFQSVESKANSAFVAKFKQRFGEDEPTNMASARTSRPTCAPRPPISKFTSSRKPSSRPIPWRRTFCVPWSSAPISRRRRATCPSIGKAATRISGQGSAGRTDPASSISSGSPN